MQENNILRWDRCVNTLWHSLEQILLWLYHNLRHQQMFESECTLLELSWWPAWLWSPLGALLLSVLCPLPALRVLPTLPVLPTLFLSPAANKNKNNFVVSR